MYLGSGKDACVSAPKLASHNNGLGSCAVIEYAVLPPSCQ